MAKMWLGKYYKLLKYYYIIKIKYLIKYYKYPLTIYMRRGGAVGLGTALQATRSRVRFSIGSLRFFVELNLSPQYGSGIDSVSNRNVCQEYFLGVKAAGEWDDNHTTFICRLPINSGSLNLLQP